MGRQKSKKQRNSGKNKKGPKNSTSEKQPSTSSWVDRLVWVPTIFEDGTDSAASESNSVQDEGDDSSLQSSDYPQPQPQQQQPETAPPPSLSVISWNVLAEAYCSRRSHPRLPAPFQRRVFEPAQRRTRIVEALHRLVDGGTENSAPPDVLCLQEVDLPDTVGPALQARGYELAVETPRVIGGGSGGRADACAVYVRSRKSTTRATATTDGENKEVAVVGQWWEVVEHQIVRFDDLATLSSSSNNSDKNNNINLTSTTVVEQQPDSKSETDDDEDGDATAAVVVSEAEAFAGNNLQGIQRSLLRRNMGLLVRLQHTADPRRTVVLANVHLYWNPGFEYVKLLQAHYILKRMKEFQRNSKEPVILCGDLNSRPHGVAHSYLSHGFINAKRVAPWYACSNRNKHSDQEETMVEEEEETAVKADTGHATDESKSSLSSLTDGVKNLAVSDENTTPSAASDTIHKTATDTAVRPRIYYMLDASLNKFCRWLRILGQDVALETDEEEKRRTGDGDPVIFDRCRVEGRTLVTTSPRLMERRDCPASAYCISPRFLSSVPKLECALLHMLRTHGVVLEPSTFLSRCVVCNGNILEVDDNDEKRRILTDHKAPIALINDGLDVYECDGCRQGYWWNDNPTSSASRVKNSASHLFEICVRAGIPFTGSYKELFGHMDVDELRGKGWDYSTPGSELLQEQLDIVDWLRDDHLQTPFSLESAYCLKNRAEDGTETLLGESIPFSNVTFGFVSVLDYIFFDKSCLQLTDRLYVPTSFFELTDGRTKLTNAHLLPSDVWPSDHLAIGARFSFLKTNEQEQEGPNEPNDNPTQPEPTNKAVTSLDFQFCAPVSTINGASSSLPASTTATAAPHSLRCTCGCVPAIPSLFEMAALRKKAQQAKSSDSSL